MSEGAASERRGDNFKRCKELSLKAQDRICLMCAMFGGTDLVLIGLESWCDGLPGQHRQRLPDGSACRGDCTRGREGLYIYVYIYIYIYMSRLV